MAPAEGAQPQPRAHRRDLQDLRDLPRAPVLSYLQKQAAPRVPRSRQTAASPSLFPKLAAFAPQRIWDWVSEYCRFRLGRKHRFQTYDAHGDDNGVYRMQGSDGEIRIALAGDWATGTDEAARIGKLIAAWEPHFSIHLGDVYYVGDPAEVGENFLGIANPANRYEPCTWPPGSEGTFALNGNHEMYARGFGYFDLMLPRLGISGSGRGQVASYFCLENEYWRIIAIDTGYNSVGLPIIEYLIQPDCALRPELLDWLRLTVRPRPDDKRGIVILGHHQYYSRFDTCYPKPARQLAGFFARPVLWFWGHEHRMAIYEESGMARGIRAFGRCIGHGGMPVDLPGVVTHGEFAVEFVDDRAYPNDENLTVGFNGFARMTLRADRLGLAYVDVEGTEIFSETWSAGPDGLVRVNVPGA